MLFSSSSYYKTPITTPKTTPTTISTIVTKIYYYYKQLSSTLPVILGFSSLLSLFILLCWFIPSKF